MKSWECDDGHDMAPGLLWRIGPKFAWDGGEGGSLQIFFKKAIPSQFQKHPFLLPFGGKEDGENKCHKHHWTIGNQSLKGSVIYMERVKKKTNV